MLIYEKGLAHRDFDWRCYVWWVLFVHWNVHLGICPWGLSLVGIIFMGFCPWDFLFGDLSMGFVQ